MSGTNQIVSIAASLQFLSIEHDDANRALMGSPTCNVRQFRFNEDQNSPIVGTGIEGIGCQLIQICIDQLLKDDGVVEYVDADEIKLSNTKAYQEDDKIVRFR
jgi:DNA-directed RNA polymerase beta subunit